MHRTSLRKVGGSTMLVVPPAILEILRLSAGVPVGMRVEGRRLIIEAARPKYTLSELLAASDYSAPASPEDREWVDAPRVGKELI
jgi:antitoxin ChpS